MFENKYIIDTEENKKFLSGNASQLLEFGRQFPSEGGGSYYLGSDGTPIKDRDRETWITARMLHVYSIGSMQGVDGCKALAEKALKGLTGELRDGENGGWFAGRRADGSIVPTKQCYAHAFVILASSSAYLAGIEGAEKLLNDALETFDKYFWDEQEGLCRDTWNTEFTVLDPYRGLNANMHTVEAFLAAADALREDVYRIRAGRIIRRVVGWAEENDYRIPEHFTEDWNPDLEMNMEKKDDPFKPYGATPGHGIEWARLITQWSLSSSKKNGSTVDTQKEIISEDEKKQMISTACQLYERAVNDAWNADGAEGLVYTTDWNGKPVVRDRMHWVLAEAINTSAVLYRVTGESKYAEDFSSFMKYLDTKVMDKELGSWYHQLDENNKVKGTVWPGKPDLYHAFQAMLIPYSNPNLSIACEIFVVSAMDN